RAIVFSGERTRPRVQQLAPSPIASPPIREAIGGGACTYCRSGKAAQNRSAGFQTCRIADFQIGCSCNVLRGAGLETGDTADSEVCATVLINPFARKTCR